MMSILPFDDSLSSAVNSSLSSMLQSTIADLPHLSLAPMDVPLTVFIAASPSWLIQRVAGRAPMTIRKASASGNGPAR
jgi:hypothetical protein